MGTKAEATYERIMDAAVTVFSSRSLAEVSMADVAEAAGVSRPALYQYVEDKEDLYARMLERVLADAASSAVAALDHSPTVEEALVGFITAAWGDRRMWRLTRHHDHDLKQAKISFARPVVDAHYEKLIAELRRYLAARAASPDQVDGWIDLLRYSPLGFTYDHPPRTVYHRRLVALSVTVADAVTTVRQTKGD